MEKKYEEMAKGYGQYAKSQDIRLNPDSKVVEMIMKGLEANQKKHGARYCPCRIITGNKQEDRKIICPCAYHKDELKQMGHCHCNLFVK